MASPVASSTPLDFDCADAAQEKAERLQQEAEGDPNRNDLP